MQTKLFCGIEHYYTDDLFLGDEERQTCPFVEYFTDGDPESMVFCFPACHIAGMIAENPAIKCKGDPWKCPLLDGALIKQYIECKELLSQAVDGKRENWNEWMRDATKVIYPEPSPSDVSVTQDVLMDIKKEQKWLELNGHKIQWHEIFVNNAYAIEYRKLIRIY